MKRYLAAILSVGLAVAMLVPAAAFAGRGIGKVPPGQAKKAAAVSSAEATEDGVDVGELPGKKTGKADKADKVKGKSEWAGSEEASGTPERSHEESGTTVRVRAGIENALAHVEANIAKAEAKVADGTKKQVPPGLLKVAAKFMSWLGIEIEVPVVDPVDDPFDGDGSGEDTMTPDPSDGTSETPVPSDGASETPDPTTE